MRIVASKAITKVISELAVRANILLRPDVLKALKSGLAAEKEGLARNALQTIIKNAKIARQKNLAICQDTGLPVVFVDIGDEVYVKGNITQAIQKGIKEGYRKAHLRESVIMDPLRRKNKTGFAPAIINLRVVAGRRINLTVLPKGFGSENKSALRMFNPTVDIDAVIDWVLEMVKNAGPDACPPYCLGIGIGGTSDEAARLAKHALLRRLDKGNRDKFLSQLEQKILKEINNGGIGAFGLGGKTTALGVSIEAAPTHIAGLPVALNISCHALRSASATI